MGSEVILVIILIGIIAFIIYPIQTQDLINKIIIKINPIINQPNTTCIESWTCNSWTTCLSNTQSRTCIDSNTCGTIKSKPTISQICTSSCSPNWQCNLWSSCSNSQQSRTCIDLNNCNINLGKPTTSQNCITCTPNCVGKCGGVSDGCSGTCNAVCNINYPDLSSYLNANPNVNNIINTLDVQTKNDINTEYNLIKLGSGDNSKTKAEKIALSIWIDNNNIVPWKLKDYSNNELASIFGIPFQGNVIIIDEQVGCDPLYTYTYTKQFIKNNKLDSISSIIDNLRRFSHAQNNQGGGGCFKDILTGSTMNGCCVASNVMSEMIRSINIPANTLNNFEWENWFIIGHCRLVIWNIGYIPHGDNIYGGTIKGTIPSKELLIPWSYVQSNIIPIQTSPNYKIAVGENPAERKYMWDLQYKYPFNGANMCYSSCLSYSHEVGDGVATPQEILNLATNSHCINVC
jgi:hypothetical protein